MPYKEKRGRKRKSGPPKMGHGGAAAKRYYRAWHRWRHRQDTFLKKHLVDMEYYVNEYDKKRQTFHPNTDNYKFMTRHLNKLLGWIEEVKEGMAKKKKENVLRRSKKETKDGYDDLSPEIQNVVLGYLQGKYDKNNNHQGFTVMSAAKATKNHTVEPVILLNKEEMLCVYKKQD